MMLTSINDPGGGSSSFLHIEKKNNFIKTAQVKFLNYNAIYFEHSIVYFY